MPLRKECIDVKKIQSLIFSLKEQVNSIVGEDWLTQVGFVTEKAKIITYEGFIQNA